MIFKEFGELKFNRMQIRFDRILDDAEVIMGQNSVKYALKETNWGNLKEGKTRRVYGTTILSLEWDCPNLLGRHKDIKDFITLAEKYVRDGTPVRKTDGMRASEGINAGIRIEVEDVLQIS